MPAALLIAVVVLPAAVAAIDLLTPLFADRERLVDIGPWTRPCQDFEVLVPIYGSISYLENVEFLRPYGSRVLLCTTDSETDEFYTGLMSVARAHGFRVMRQEVRDAGRATGARRRVSGTVRDCLIREALRIVRAPYEVCIDADTVTKEPLELLMGAFRDSGRDFASVRLVPTGAPGLLLRLQRHEYRLAMRRRMTHPWMVSGACHIARTEAHLAIMERHSLFFQGNDVEMGLLGDALGYTSTHLRTEVLTTVPDELGPWLRQRLAWAGGEFRVLGVNAFVLLRHPGVLAYGLGITIALTPWRWHSVVAFSWPLLSVYLVYAGMLAVCDRRHLDWTLLCYPLYAVVNGLLLVPFGWIWYLKMAVQDRNAGVIRVGPRPAAVRSAGR
ncbi:glycosyltransferase family 2 protein [Streptomyces olivaceiscleroticus]|uniref:Glycosyltransferase 2-like domain-containing protein n=1 Tax=Streptomyces olivaceiscleroticus TaxID=68245 RepID=A0ABP3L7H8_9ACTN